MFGTKPKKKFNKEFWEECRKLWTVIVRMEIESHEYCPIQISVVKDTLFYMLISYLTRA
jgi:hypothetical protein